MIAISSRVSCPKLRMPWRRLGWHALTGFLFGYAVLHPVSMIIFQWLDPRMANAMPCCHPAEGLVTPIAHSFQLDMLPMAMVFGLIGASIAVFYGYHRLAVSFQRDRLAEQLGHNEKLRADLAHRNEQLAALELANRRTTQYMAHDFKTALNCVGGFAGQLLAKPALRSDSEVTEALSCIRRQSHRMMGAVLDLLQLARMREQGKPPMQRLAATDVLQDALSDFSLPTDAAHIAMGEQHQQCPPILANSELVRRVLCNLVANSIKHNGPNTHVVLDAELSEGSQEVIFSCTDDGEGIPPDILPSLFQKFRSTSASSNGSTGLGLAFCRSAVESHWGRIWCENLSRGSRFCFTIPLSKEHSNGQCVYDI